MCNTEGEPQLIKCIVSNRHSTLFFVCVELVECSFFTKERASLYMSIPLVT